MNRLFLLPLAATMLGQDDARIRVSVTLVQVDAAVTDREGKQVRDLTQDDFEVFEDGKRRTLRNFSYVRSGGVSSTRGAVGTPQVSTAKPAAPEVSRTIALLIDDLGMSFPGVHRARQALHAFVDRQMQPGDLVAVLSTSGGISSLQPFTTDKRQLHAAIDSLRYLLWAGGAGGAMKAIGTAGEDNGMIDAMRKRRFSVGVMGGVQYVARGMRSLPGRRAVVLFSEGIQTSKGDKDDPSLTAGEIMRVAGEANRSAVVVYGMDVRGVVYPGLQAMDMVGDLEAAEVQEAIEERIDKVRNTQQGLALLARETGGHAFLNGNDLNGGLGRILEDQSGYYLLGYGRPEEDAGKRNRLTVRLRRPGLRLRYRRGALGDDEADKAQPANVKDRLFAALASPFRTDGISFRFSPSFRLNDNKQAELKGLLYFDQSQLSFGEPDSAGLRSAKVHILAVAEDEAGWVGGARMQAYTVKTKEVTQGGFVYSLRHEMKKPGLYQWRVAVLDEASGRVGSASRLVDVPDVRKGAIAISGISMVTGDWRSRLREGDADGEQDDLSAAVRVFQRNAPFSFGLVVYNARPGAGIEPKLVGNAGQVVWEGQRIPLTPNGSAGLGGGVLRLGEKSVPGEYLLEVRLVAQDGKPLGISQWVDFELR